MADSVAPETATRNSARDPVRDPARDRVRTRIKFCGLTRLDDLQAAIDLGVDAIGLVFDPASRRALSVADARPLRHALPPFVAAVALFRDSPDALVAEVIAELDPDLLQFHGQESAEACSNWGRRYLKAIPMAADIDLHAWRKRYANASGWLLDGHAPGALGGAGVAFDWSRIPKSLDKLIVAGGLHPGNVADAVTLARPYAVDVSSGIESAPGQKDAQKMSAFVAAVRRADSS